VDKTTQDDKTSSDRLRWLMDEDAKGGYHRSEKTIKRQRGNEKYNIGNHITYRGRVQPEGCVFL